MTNDVLTKPMAMTSVANVYQPTNMTANNMSVTMAPWRKPMTPVMALCGVMAAKPMAATTNNQPVAPTSSQWRRNNDY